MLNEEELLRMAQSIEDALAQCGVKVEAVTSASANRVQVVVDEISPEAVDAVERRWGGHVTLLEGTVEMDPLQQ